MDRSHIDEVNRIGDKLLFENDRVRIWSLSLEPGEESPLHRHEHDYVMVCIEGDRAAGKAEPGQGTPYGPAGDYLEAAVWPGQTLFVQGGVLETAVNTGTQPYRNVLIELL